MTPLSTRVAPHCAKASLRSPRSVAKLFEENGSVPAEFLLGDYTTFKVVVKNADVIENGTGGTDKTPEIVVHTTESGTDTGIDDPIDVNNGTKRNDSGTISGTMRNDTMILIG